MQQINRAILILGVANLLSGLPFSAQAMPAQILIAQKSTDQLFKQGTDQIASKDYKAAIETFSQLLQLNSKDSDSYYNRGLAYAQLKDYQKAIADFTSAVQLNPNDVESYYRRGLVRSEVADNSAAVDDFTSVLKQKPDDAKAYFNRGLAYAELNQDTKAIEDLQKASELFAKQGKKAESIEALSLIKKLQSQPPSRG